MNVLVTGGAGFIGTNLIKKLLDKKYNVISVDNYSTGRIDRHLDGANYLEYDVNDIDSYINQYKFDAVFHLAALARIQPSFEKPVDSFISNSLATFRLAHYCAINNIPLIYAGTSSHHSGKFKNPYTFAKDIGEDAIRLFQEHYNLKSSISRFYNVYGPYQSKDGAYCNLLGIWEKCIEENQPLIVTLSLNIDQINAILSGLGELPTKHGVWPLTQVIISQVQEQLPPAKEASDEEQSEV